MSFAVDTALKLDRIMRNSIRALERQISPILAFSTVMRDEPLSETNTVQVPFYPLESTASKNFDGSYNFATGANATLNTLPVTVNKRKYQVLELTSKEIARNTIVDLTKIVMMKVERLAEDVLTDIHSVITLANYGAAILDTAASNFDRDDVADMRTTLNSAHWPNSGRSLVLDSAHEGALVKDLLDVQTVGTDAALREGSSGRLVGFDIFHHPGMPTNSELLVGYATLPYSILVAFSPIPPAQEVRDQLSDYRKFTTKHGLTLEMRKWGDPLSDSAKMTIEINYGYAVGDTAQLKRITKPS